MNSIAFLVVLIFSNVLGLCYGSDNETEAVNWKQSFLTLGSQGKISKRRRDTSGALQIFTNHAKPIHADIKNDNTGLSEKPCLKMNLGITPSIIEPGTVFQVTPPKDVYMGRSLRKSYPINSKLDLIRAISRVITIISLLFSAVVEFYPVVRHLYDTVCHFIE